MGAARSIVQLQAHVVFVLPDETKTIPVLTKIVLVLQLIIFCC